MELEELNAITELIREAKRDAGVDLTEKLAKQVVEGIRAIIMDREQMRRERQSNAR